MQPSARRAGGQTASRRPKVALARRGLLLLVAHRHVVLTIPRLLRLLFRRRRELLGELARAGPRRKRSSCAIASGEADAGPGLFVSVASAGDLLLWHPHLHIITTDGG